MTWRALGAISALTLVPGRLAAGVSPREIVERSLQFETLFRILDLSPPPDYLCLVEMASRRVDAAGEPMPRFTWEMMNLYGETFQRLIRRNGEELLPDKARAEQARFDKVVEKRAHETPEARAKAERKFQTERTACLAEFMRTFDFELASLEAVGGRPAWVVEASPLPNRVPQCSELKTLGKFHFKIWIDQAESRWARLEGDNIAPVTGFLWPQRQSAGGIHFTSEQTRYGDGVWLRTKEQYKTNVKTLMLSFPMEMTVTYSGYRKFQADSHIVPVDGK